MTLTWILGFNVGEKFGIYCSDVSGAFDRVEMGRMIEKLNAKGTHSDLVRVLESWLRTRRAHVIVGGARGCELSLRDMVYQGTVWGPWLWNIFYEDARLAVHAALFREIIFADDLNAFRAFKLAMPNADVFEATAQCQKELHAWGRANQVAFDPMKESQHVVSHVHPASSNFKFLGILFDCSLTMAAAVHEVVGEVRWKTATLMRSRRYHSVSL